MYNKIDLVSYSPMFKHTPDLHGLH